MSAADADGHDVADDIDDDTVVVDDDHEADESDAVMVDALEALRLAQPHMARSSSSSSTLHDGPHTDENQRPQTAIGSRHSLDDNVLSDGSPDSKGLSLSKSSPPSRRRASNRLAPFGDGPMWAMFGKGSKDDSDCNGTAQDFGGSSASVQSGLQSRLAEAAEDMHIIAGSQERQQPEDSTFSSSQYWKMPLAMPDDIENA